MGISERKEREKQEMRDLILNVATAMFIEEGYDKTSIRKIADKIEYSPATIYLYFKDKDEIFHAIHDKGFDKFFALMETTRSIENPFDRLVRLSDLYIDFAYENPEYYDLMFIMMAPIEALTHNNEDWTCGFQAYDFLKALIKECIEQGYMKEMDVEIAALSIWSFKHGMTSLAIRNRFKMYSEAEVKKLMKESCDMMLDLFRKK
jgi:AcrR family transcriptional regulator